MYRDVVKEICTCEIFAAERIMQQQKLGRTHHAHVDNAAQGQYFFPSVLTKCSTNYRSTQLLVTLSVQFSPRQFSFRV